MLAELFVEALTWYAVAGVAFAIVFLVRGVSRIDEHAAGSGVAFRLIIFPGAAALWPVLLQKWIRFCS